MKRAVLVVALVVMGIGLVVWQGWFFCGGQVKQVAVKTKGYADTQKLKKKIGVTKVPVSNVKSDTNKRYARKDVVVRHWTCKVWDEKRKEYVDKPCNQYWITDREDGSRKVVKYKGRIWGNIVKGLWTKIVGAGSKQKKCTIVEGRIVDEKGRGVKDVVVRLWAESYTMIWKDRDGKDLALWKRKRFVFTDDQGHYRACISPDKAYMMTLTCNDYLNMTYRECRVSAPMVLWTGTTRPVHMKVEDFVFHHPFEGVLEGNLLSRTTGKTYKGKIQTICIKGTYQGLDWHGCWGSLMGVHLKEGRKYRIQNLPPGTGTIEGIIYGAPWPRIKGIKIKPRGVTEYDIIVDDRPQGFYGYVRDKETGKPLAHVSVDIDPKPGIGWGGTLATSETNDKGFYKIRGIPAGLWDITAYNSGHNYTILTLKKKRILSGKMTRLDIFLPPAKNAAQVYSTVTKDPHTSFPSNSGCNQKLQNSTKKAFNAGYGKILQCLKGSPIAAKAQAHSNDTVPIKCSPTPPTANACGKFTHQGKSGYFTVFTDNKGNLSCGTGTDKQLESTMFHEWMHYLGYDENDAYACTYHCYQDDITNGKVNDCYPCAGPQSQDAAACQEDMQDIAKAHGLCQGVTNPSDGNACPYCLLTLNPDGKTASGHCTKCENACLVTDSDGNCQKGNPCEDSSLCTTDLCVPGVNGYSCKHIPKNCDDHNDCTADTCNPQKGCEHLNLCGGQSGSSGNGSPGSDNDQPDESASPHAGPRGPGDNGNAHEGPVEKYRVGVLRTGYYEEAKALVQAAGAMAEYVWPDFDPYEVLDDGLRFLFIPSGGLAQVAGLGSFKAALLVYVENGGVVMSMTQAWGWMFDALPGGIKGFGWNEVQSCYGGGADVNMRHAVVSGVSAHCELPIDGEADAVNRGDVLVTRGRDALPEVVLKPVGKGAVLWTGLYADFAHDTSPDVLHLMRDAVAWAYSNRTVQVYSPGDTVTITLPDVVDFQVWDPDFSAIYKQDTGDKVTFTAPSGSPGIWHVLVQGENGNLHECPDCAFAIAFWNQAGLARTLSVSITAPAEKLPVGSTMPFTVILGNHTDQDMGLRCNTWMNHPDQIGEVVHKIVVPAHGTKVFTDQRTLEGPNGFMVMCMDEGGGKQYPIEWKHVDTFLPLADVSVQPATGVLGPGDTVKAEVDMKDKSKQDWDGVLNVDLVGPAQGSILHKQVPVHMQAGKTLHQQVDLGTLPACDAGQYVLRAVVTQTKTAGFGAVIVDVTCAIPVSWP